MGYTRYWQRTKKPISKEFIDIVNSIIQDCVHRGITICGRNGEGSPVVTEDKISINGNAEVGLEHENFYIDGWKESVGFEFCKTARKPYDYAVRRILEEAEALGLVENVDEDTPSNTRIISDEEYLTR